MNASESFAHKGKNFMTPVRLEIGTCRDCFYELSTNREIPNPADYGMSNLFGVTIIDKGSHDINHDRSKCFTSKSEAMEYINSLK